MTISNKTKAKPLALILSWSAVLLCMAGIFLLSRQTAEESSELSRGFLKALMETLRLDIPHAALRALAHGAVFFILAVPVCIAMRITLQRDAPLQTFALCVLYAFTDELHQFFVPGRAFQFRDILFDALGAAAGIGLCAGVAYLYRWRKRRNRR